MTIIGITGTRKGMSAPQKNIFANLTARAISSGPIVFRHGACVGVDQHVHEYAEKYRIPVVVHPPINKKLIMPPSSWGYFTQPKGYLERDRDIVDKSNVLWAFPDGPRRKGSGTWYTIDYATEKTVLTYIVYPGGSEDWAV